MLTVITGWSPKGYEEYGHRFVETFTKHWPKDVRCIAYVEKLFVHPRIECRLLHQIPACMEFLQRWTHTPAANGRVVRPGWKQRELQAGYSFRHDAVKFCKQAFIPLAAATELDAGLMCWLDADVVTFRDVPEGFIESLLPQTKDLAFLGRGHSHSEIGFQLYRLPGAEEMLHLYQDAYASGGVFSLREWHSAYVFDRARVLSGVSAIDLTPGGHGHVWFSSPLCQYMDHLKGDRRKRAGHSTERPW